MNKLFDKIAAIIPKRQLVIRINTDDYRNGLWKARLLTERLERQVRIQKLEIAVKEMNITRSPM